MAGRSQIHKERIQGVRSDGSFQDVLLDHALVDQTSGANVADSYQFAANSFSTLQGALRYQAHSIVAGVPRPLVAGIAFNEATRTLSWTKAAGTYTVRITATDETGISRTDDFDIVVSTVTVANPLVDQTSSNGVADTYQFAANTFTDSLAGAMTYAAQSVVAGVAQALVSGFVFTAATRTLDWTKATGTYTVRITATNAAGAFASDDFDIVVT